MTQPVTTRDLTSDGRRTPGANGEHDAAHADLREGGISVLIPAYNEQDAIRSSIDQVRAALDLIGAPYEIIVIDDGSDDETRSRAGECDVRIITHPQNRGYGAALKTGIRAARHE